MLELCPLHAPNPRMTCQRADRCRHLRQPPMQFGFQTEDQNPNVLIGFGLTTAVVVRSTSCSIPAQSDWHQPLLTPLRVYPVCSTISPLPCILFHVLGQVAIRNEHELHCILSQVALSFSSMTMCGLIHASILKMGRSYVTEEEEAEFIHHCRNFALR